MDKNEQLTENLHGEATISLKVTKSKFKMRDHSLALVNTTLEKK